MNVTVLTSAIANLTDNGPGLSVNGSHVHTDTIHGAAPNPWSVNTTLYGASDEILTNKSSTIAGVFTMKWAVPPVEGTYEGWESFYFHSNEITVWLNTGSQDYQDHYRVHAPDNRVVSGLVVTYSFGGSVQTFTDPSPSRTAYSATINFNMANTATVDPIRFVSRLQTGAWQLGPGGAGGNFTWSYDAK